MGILANNIDDKKLTAIFKWFAIIILIMGIHYLKDFFQFILMKLYEFFIQRNAMGL